MKTRLLLTTWMLMTAGGALAELSMPTVFDNHMVLQAGKPVAVWGKDQPGTSIQVTFAGKSATAKADASGKWKAMLPVMQASDKGKVLEVSNGKQKKTFEDVVVGEVWFASGQSNMQWALSAIPSGKEDIPKADVPGVRFYQVKPTADGTPQDDVPGAWSVSSPETAGKYSAVGYYFARKLHAELGVPVGIVQSAWGGKPVETFTSREALLSIPEGKGKMEGQEKAIASFDPAVAAANFEKAKQAYAEELAKWEATPKEQRKGRGPGRPRMPENPGKVAGRPATIWNGMIAPLAGYTQRGAIWYQGESNANNADEYGKLFSLMIEDWRKHWGDEFRFLWVQLADFREPVKEPGTNQPWVVVQDHQRRCLELPKTGMAVINDIGDAKNIHPPNKKDVGERLARWALADDYGKDVVKCGPLYKAHQISGGEVNVEFDHVAGGLKSRDGGELKHFEIKAADGTWHWAKAAIKGNGVVISADGVGNPVAARYAWASNPAGSNLVNSEGLPASCFTTE